MLPPDDFDPPVGTAITLEPGLRRIVADNPSPMTYRGTNTYLLGTTDIAVIDPGPASDAHLNAILKAIRPTQRISHIIVTHTHLDHSPLARQLSTLTGAPVFGFGNATAGRSSVMKQLTLDAELGGGEGIDTSFCPDRHLSDGDTVSGDTWQLDVLHTPGHIGNHICLGWGDACFTAGRRPYRFHDLVRALTSTRLANLLSRPWRPCECPHCKARVAGQSSQNARGRNISRFGRRACHGS